MASRAEQLFALGQSVWLDFIRRGHLLSGEFDRLVAERGIVGVTSNPTIFQLAIADSDDYDAAIQAGAARGLKDGELFEALAVEDIQMACDRLRPVYDATRGIDGRVSIEVSPRLAADTDGSVEEARRLHRSVARDNLYVKVPATEAGIPAIRTLIADGISINVTLIFSLARYEQVIDAYLRGLEQRAERGLPLAPMFSVASFFVSRVDSKVDQAIERRLAERLSAADHDELKSFTGHAAIANARLAYRKFKQVFGSARFAALQARGANLQRPLWASTSTKNKAYRDVRYVEELIGPNTVNTMPPQTLEAFNDHGVVEVRIERDLDRARTLFERLPALGIPVDALIAELELEGVAAFTKSYDALLASLETKRRDLVASGGSSR
ncbi:MAG TPA: transaldolase [Candidatus Limnocylindria bacterium]|nr:transaldolase [Candidatus Limnocylindria bacterium]